MMMESMRKTAHRFDSAGCSLDDDMQEIERHLQELGDDDSLSSSDDAFITFKTTETRCEELYERGVGLKSQRLEDALWCFLECLKGMQECQYFAKLPQTLHELANVYRALENFDKALEFAQTEKLFCEAVKKGGVAGNCSKQADDPAEYGDLLVRKANEFEQVARVCAQEKKFQQALDYCGKAEKIRQCIFGPEHPIRIAALEYFTVLNAEAGKAEHTVAVQQPETSMLSETVLTSEGRRGYTLSLNERASVCMELEEQCKGKRFTCNCQTVQHHVQECKSTTDLIFDKEGLNQELNCGQSGFDDESPQLEEEMEPHTDTIATGAPASTMPGVIRIFKSVPLWLLVVALFTQVAILAFFL